MFSLNKPLTGYIILSFILLEHLGLAAGRVFIPFYFIIEAVFLICMAVMYRSFIYKLVYLYKFTPFYYLILFYIWAVITIIMSKISGTFYLKSFISSFIGGLNFSVVLVFITSYFLFEQFIQKSKFIKYYFLFYLFVFSLGFIELLMKKLMGGVPGTFYHLFNNQHTILGIETVKEGALHISGRIKSIFNEPSSLGEFIYLNLPVIYKLTFSKHKIFKVMDKFLKKSLLYLMLICFIFTQSPMSFVFFSVISFVYFYKKIFLFLKKNIVIFIFALSIISIFILAFLLSIDINQTFLKRIIISIPVMFDFNNLIHVEPSLATRIIDNMNAVLIFLKFPLFGIGYGNITGYIFVHLLVTPLPMTKELLLTLISGTGSPPYGVFYRVLAETGIAGVYLLYLYFFKILRMIKIKPLQCGIEKDFLEGIGGTLLIYITLAAFYNSSLHKTFIFILCAYAVYIITSKERNTNGCINNTRQL